MRGLCLVFKRVMKRVEGSGLARVLNLQGLWVKGFNMAFMIQGSTGFG